MKKFIAKLMGLKTQEEYNKVLEHTREEVTEQRRSYYNKVLDQMHRDGTLPPNCDLMLPKASVIVTNTETGEVVAEDGKWKKLPEDGLKVTISYRKPQ